MAEVIKPKPETKDKVAKPRRVKFHRPTSRNPGRYLFGFTFQHEKSHNVCVTTDQGKMYVVDNNVCEFGREK